MTYVFSKNLLILLNLVILMNDMMHKRNNQAMAESKTEGKEDEKVRFHTFPNQISSNLP